MEQNHDVLRVVAPSGKLQMPAVVLAMQTNASTRCLRMVTAADHQERSNITSEDRIVRLGGTVASRMRQREPKVFSWPTGLRDVAFLNRRQCQRPRAMPRLRENI